ncbi:MAG: S26 family signal peptidase [Bacteroidia bacterium]|nr:S26 family signal peptidase [Bacteroidia bacterium]
MTGNLVFLVIVFISFFGMARFFKTCNAPPWHALIPFFNFYRLSQLLKKPWWWALITLVPGVNLIMWGVYGFNTARAINKTSTLQLLLASLLPPIFFISLIGDKKIEFVGLDKYHPEPSKFIKEWVDPIVFATVAASIIRTFFIEAFTIPTSSLEKTLMVGDFLFVNKLAYGPRIPQTVIAFPFSHHTLIGTDNIPAYVNWVKLPYMRIPIGGKVERNEIVVFNYPDGDTVIQNMQDISYYQVVRIIAALMKNEDEKAGKKTEDQNYYHKMAWEYVHQPNNINPLNEKPFGKIVARPVDKREHYVKRCVAIAGDTLEIKDGVIYINQKEQPTPEHAQFKYFVTTKGAMFGERMEMNGKIVLSNFKLLDELDIYIGEGDLVQTKHDTCIYLLTMPKQTVKKLEGMEGIIKIQRKIEPKGQRDMTVFPHHEKFPWNNDNFGPLIIPYKGMTIKMDSNNYILYRTILTTYDDFGKTHQVEMKNGKVYYDEQPIETYTFKQDYYWMMGDNRHNSADSRSWGFVPFDHVVGEPFFIWMSVKYADNNPVSGKSIIGSFFKNSREGKFRWERFLCYVGHNGLVSLKIPILSLIFGIWAYNKWKKRKSTKQKKNK